ncbi:hypothetical protein ACFOEE_10270 [Pseudoalteromonas fenneropenaei]|uniref:ATP-grasp domain-containing protein n=1 Tax=Pseudoalteromonas fenneropenaei TaxID=1737459 RepID=A0ABV7CJT0_9GAMM
MVKAVYWAHFDPEAYWQPASHIKLPTIAMSQTAIAIALLDELYLPEADGDLALTLVRPDPALSSYHQAIGLVPTRHWVFANVGQWQKLGKPNWLALFAQAAAWQAEHSNIADAFALLGQWPHRPYAYIEAIRNIPEFCDDLPQLNAVLNANSKSYVTQLSQHLAIRCDGVLVETREDIEAVFELPLPFVIKEAFGVSGRGSIKIQQPEIAERCKAYLLKQCRQDTAGLVVQQWFEKELDFSSQWWIDKDGEVTLLGVCEIANQGFKFVGVNPCRGALMKQLEQGEYFSQLKQLLQSLHQQGYYGPAGVDSMLLKDGSIYPVLEVNARQTMGNIALSWFARFAHLPQLSFRQYDVQYVQPLDFEQLLQDLAQAGVLYEQNHPRGMIPLLSSNLQLELNKDSLRGRWAHLETPAVDGCDYVAVLNRALLRQGAKII